MGFWLPGLSRFDNWLSLNRLVGFSWSMKSKILETTSSQPLFQKPYQYLNGFFLIFEKIGLYNNCFYFIYGSWNLEFCWSTVYHRRSMIDLLQPSGSDSTSGRVEWSSWQPRQARSPNLGLLKGNWNFIRRARFLRSESQVSSGLEKWKIIKTSGSYKIRSISFE